MYFFFGSRSACVSGIGVGRSPLSLTVLPIAEQALAEAGDADRRRTHVDAPAVAAEVERDAMNVDGALAGESVQPSGLGQERAVRAERSSIQTGL